MTVNGTRNALLREVQEADFMVVELNLYLDTHPECEEAFAAYQTALQQAAEARRQFEDSYGPLSAASVGEQYHWVNCPWPWEKEAN